MSTRRGLIKAGLAMAFAPLVSKLAVAAPNKKAVVPLATLGHIESVYYFRTAFDRHEAGVPRVDAEGLAQEVCKRVWGEDVLFPPVPWEKFELHRQLSRKREAI